jgi:hypothetical protein
MSTYKETIFDMLKRSNAMFKEFYSIMKYYKFGLDVCTELISIDNDKHSTDKQSLLYITHPPYPNI